MGCCGSTVDVREMKRPADASDDESDAGDWSGATMLLKAEARRLFAIVDEGACPSHAGFDPPASRSSIHGAARPVLLSTDSSGQLDRTELRQLVELMSKGPILARFGGARRTIARALLHLTRCCGLCTHCDDVRSRKPSLSRCRSSVGGRARCSDVRDGR